MKYEARELVTMYDEMLDDCHGTVEVAGYEYETSRLLKEVDPIAYKCGFLDFANSLQQDDEEITDDLICDASDSF